MSHAYLGYISGISQVYLRHLIGKSQAYLSYISGISRGYLGYILLIVGEYLRYISSKSHVHLRYNRHILALFQVSFRFHIYLRHISGISQSFVMCILEISQTFLLGISWAALRHILGLVQEYSGMFPLFLTYLSPS